MPSAIISGARAPLARSRAQLTVLGVRPSPQTSLRTSFHPSSHDQQPPARTEVSNSCVRTLKRRSCHSSGSTGPGWAAGQAATKSTTTCRSLDNESHGDNGSGSSNPFKVAAQVIEDASASVADGVGAQSAADSMDATAEEGKKAGGSLLQAGRDLKEQLKSSMPGSSSSSTTGDTVVGTLNICQPISRPSPPTCLPITAASLLTTHLLTLCKQRGQTRGIELNLCLRAEIEWWASTLPREGCCRG